MSKTETFHVDSSYTVIAEAKDGYADFTIYELIGTEMDGTPCMWRDEEDQYVDSVEKAAVYISGSVRWDGCSNWFFDVCAKQNTAIHGCTRGALTGIGDVLAACWDWAKANGVIING